MPFNPLPKEKFWQGRYRRIAGKEPCYHVTQRNIIILNWIRHNEKGKCLIRPQNREEGSHLYTLARYINKIKQKYNGMAGGSFVINEFGQVIVPTRQGGRYYIGDWIGDIYFENTMNNNEITTLDSDNLEIGDIWKKPYIGIVYNLDQNDRICFRETDEEGQEWIYLPKNLEDRNLIGKLRSLRPLGFIRFIVNHYGVVLTKIRNRNNKVWIPVFVSKINYKYWFQKEE